MSNRLEWISFGVSGAALAVSVVGVIASWRQAKSAERQAEIARKSADDAKETAALSKSQMRAALRPILKMVCEENKIVGKRYFIENGSDGPARIEYFNTHYPPSKAPYLESKVVPPHGRIQVTFDREAAKLEGIEIRYWSEDGRRFETIAKLRMMPFQPDTFIHDDREIPASLTPDRSY